MLGIGFEMRGIGFESYESVLTSGNLFSKCWETVLKCWESVLEESVSDMPGIGFEHAVKRV